MVTKPNPTPVSNEHLKLKLVAYFLGGFIISFWGAPWALILGLALIFLKDKIHKKLKIVALVAGILLFIFTLFPFIMENRFEREQNNLPPPQAVFPELNSVYSKISKDYPDGKLSVEKKDEYGITSITVKYTSKTKLLPNEVIDSYGLEACKILKLQGKQPDKYVITIDTVLLSETQLSKFFPVPVAYYNHGTRCDTWLDNANNP